MKIKKTIRMEQDQINFAIAEAMRDPKLVKAFAESISRKIMQVKSSPINDEERMIKKHVVFAGADDVDGNFMTSSEIMSSIHEFAPDFEYRVRSFGKALLLHAVSVKQTNKGRAYLVKAITEDLKEYASGLCLPLGEEIRPPRIIAITEDVEEPSNDEANEEGLVRSEEGGIIDDEGGRVTCEDPNGGVRDYNTGEPDYVNEPKKKKKK